MKTNVRRKLNDFKKDISNNVNEFYYKRKILTDMDKRILKLISYTEKKFSTGEIDDSQIVDV